MYRIEDRRKAVELRLKGFSYSEIKKNIKVGNGTLCYWLKDYPLTSEQRDKIYSKRDLWVEKFRESMKIKREKKLKEVYLKQKSSLGRFSDRDFLFAGVGLYWGEGQKGSSAVSVCNSDPEVVRFSLSWLEKCFGMDRRSHKFKVYLNLYSDMDIEEEIDYWKNSLDLNIEQFGKPYVKKSKRSDLDHKSFGHGTCRIQVADVKIKNEIMMTIRLLSESIV